MRLCAATDVNTSRDRICTDELHIPTSSTRVYATLRRPNWFMLYLSLWMCETVSPIPDVFAFSKDVDVAHSLTHSSYFSSIGCTCQDQ